jgi:hypothetical protein
MLKTTPQGREADSGKGVGGFPARPRANLDPNRFEICAKYGYYLGHSWSEKGGFKVSEKRDNFIRLAEGRVTRAIDSIRVIGNLSNRSNYEYTEEDSKKIIDALQSEVNALKVQFKPKPTSNKGFKLKK